MVLDDQRRLHATRPDFAKFHLTNATLVKDARRVIKYITYEWKAVCFMA